MTAEREGGAAAAPGNDDDAIDMILANPVRGDVIEGGGGIRKARFAVGGRGKRGGVRRGARGGGSPLVVASPSSGEGEAIQKHAKAWIASPLRGSR